jgi:hypothetical protein
LSFAFRSWSVVLEGSGRDFIPLRRMVVFLICLSWNVLLGLLLWWHRELFFGWYTVGTNVGGYPKIWIRSPNTWERTVDTFKRSDDEGGD